MVSANRYGRAARRHWQRWLPGQYAQIDDPDGYFAAAGEDAAQRIDALADDLAGDGLPGEGYLAAVARLTAARRRAETLVMAGLMPGPVNGDPDGDTERLCGRPLAVWRGHPEWPDVNAEQRERLWADS
jgi:hypothetical protein